MPGLVRQDRVAFTRLFETYAPMVHGILLARVPRAEADDLMQDVFVAAWQRMDTLRDGEAAGAWLAAIARNRVTDFLRSRPTLVELPAELQAREDPRRAEVAEVLRAIRSLPEAFREPLVLRLVEGMTGEEIAERCGFTYDSVRVNLHRGMQKLREALKIEVKRE
ncbi:MAG TPA: sigma-70 family RNA polymerase sigma factor [Myxococcaceae bacterium]|nr:sigma-70 family RNA polymerase sigma factor [Myxococcaceae bacterium]